MREILFRGKRADNGEWMYGTVVHSRSLKNRPYICIVPFKDGISVYADIREVIPETVGQFTGMLDKNGNKIFEGDIVLYSWDCDGKAVPFYIEYVDGEFRATPKHITEDIWSIRVSGYTFDFEVIGNIHDNPELLKGE